MGVLKETVRKLFDRTKIVACATFELATSRQSSDENRVCNCRLQFVIWTLGGEVELFLQELISISLCILGQRMIRIIELDLFRT